MSPRTLEVTLPDDLASEVAAAVEQGEYVSERDVVLEAIAEWRAQSLVETCGRLAGLR